MVKLVGTGTGAWVSFEGTRDGTWIRFKGAGIGTRLGFGSGIEHVIKAKVLPTSGVGTEFGLLGTLAVSNVLV